MKYLAYFVRDKLKPYMSQAWNIICSTDFWMNITPR